MNRRPPMAAVLWAVAALALAVEPVAARDWLVTAQSETSLAEALELVSAGDRIIVDGGRHSGPVEITRPLTLEGRNWPVIEGQGHGTVISVRAPGTAISGFVVRGSGSSLDEENSGLTLDESPGSRIVGNRFEDVLFGIYLRKSSRSEVLENEISSKRLPLPRRGDAIRVWYSNDVRIEDNRVRDSRDVVLWYSERLSVRGNRVSGGRYGLHFMYCDDTAIEANRLTDNSVGAFLMYSRRLRLRRNTFAGNHGPSGFGVGLKDMDDAEVADNRFVGNRVGIFLDNSPRESGSRIEVSSNSLSGNDIGISLLPNVARGRFLDNSFVENQQQVEVSGGGTEPADNLWSGNYWSNYVGYDADRDGVGDVPFSADRLFEDLADRRPALKLFLYSPAKEALEVAARTVPLIRPRPRLVDESPRMTAREAVGGPPLELSAGLRFRSLGLALVALAALLLTGPAVAMRREVEDSIGGPAREVASAERHRRPLIEARGMTKRFGDTVALDRVDLEIAAGESVAIWGPNGAGKTTLLRALLGLLPFEGEARIAGTDPWRDGRDARSMIGFVPQEVSLQRDLRVGETLELFARLRGTAGTKILPILGRLGLDDEIGKRVGDLSGGQRQRLALALALISEPPILFLDEPTANLDSRARAGFIALLDELKAGGQTLLFSSHRPEEVLALADRVLYLEAGKLVADGPPAEVLDSRARRAEIWLRVAADQLDSARELLAASGFSPRLVGEHLVVETGAGGKLQPIRTLDGGGVELLDFEVDLIDRPGGRDRG